MWNTYKVFLKTGEVRERGKLAAFSYHDMLSKHANTLSFNHYTHAMKSIIYYVHFIAEETEVHKYANYSTVSNW